MYKYIHTRTHKCIYDHIVYIIADLLRLLEEGHALQCLPAHTHTHTHTHTPPSSYVDSE
jgi:hypothetical protein